MKTKKPSSAPPDPSRVPPQLIGIIDDARREKIDTFTLEYSRGLVMASFSALNHATEIDFELEAGEEMLRFLRAGAPARQAEQWPMRCTYESETFALEVERLGSGPKSALRVRWAIAANQPVPDR